MLTLVNMNVYSLFWFASTSRCIFRWNFCEKVVESSKICVLGVFVVVAILQFVFTQGGVPVVGGNMG